MCAMSQIRNTISVAANAAEGEMFVKAIRDNHKSHNMLEELCRMFRTKLAS
jgi:hypothetical protein